MKPPYFDYIAPTSLPAAIEQLADSEREVKVLAGGQSLIPLLNFRLARPDVLVDIGRIDTLRTLRVDPSGDLRIGANVRHADAEHSPVVRHGWGLLADAISYVGHPQIRNRGTVCGSLAHHDPSSELPMAAIALDARLGVEGPDGHRDVPAADFFLSTFETNLQPGEMVVEVVLPALPPGAGWSVHEVARRRGDFAMVAAAARLQVDADYVVSSAHLVFAGVGSTPIRVADAEQLLVGRRVDERAARDVGECVAAVLNPPSDVHASTQYRREAAAVLARRVVTEAWARSGR